VDRVFCSRDAAVGIKVRLAATDDIDALVEVECSGVDTWYHYSSKGRGDQASYAELKSWERVMHGGPWMDVTALAEYWKRIERLGIKPLVAEVNGKVVGHLDVIFSDELPLGRFLYLDVLTVHKAYRRLGIASILINEAERLGKHEKAKLMLVQPEEYEGASGLTYRSCGFEKAFDTFNLKTTVNHPKIPPGTQLVSIPHTQEAPLKTHTLVCGWYNIGAKMWDNGVNPYLELLHALSCSQLVLSAPTNKGTYFLHLKHDYFDHSRGILCLWAPTPSPNQKVLKHIFQAAKTLASSLGIKELTTITIEKHTDLLRVAGFALKSKAEPYLIKKLG
jgi:ribosomal protein S18 acetylase RimI-like enzyme